MAQKLLNLNQKILEFFKNYHIKKTELNGYVFDFSVAYDAIIIDNILDIHKYLMKKNDIV